MNEFLSNVKFYIYATLRVPWLECLVLAYFLSRIFTGMSVDAAKKFDFLSRPNFRSSHKVPTPRIGGVGMLVAFLAVMAFTQCFNEICIMPYHWVFALALGGVWAAVGGFLDDVYEFTPPWKALFQLVPLGFIFIFDLTLKTLYIPFVGNVTLPYWLQVISTGVIVIGMMNVYNFMDGMDGNAASFAIFVFGGLFVNLFSIDSILVANELMILCIFIGALIGFLAYNSPDTPPENKTFMGDCGSQFIGFALAVMVLRCNTLTTHTPFLGSVIFVSPFVYDVVYTLTHRLWRRVNVFRAHREHLYQRMLILCNENHAQALRFATGQFLVAFLLGLFYNVSNVYAAYAQYHMLSQHVTRANWMMIAFFTLAILCLIADTIYIRRRERKARERVAVLPEQSIR